MMGSIRASLKALRDDERGSASVEFVLLAIPLFIPLFIFLNSFASSSEAQEVLRTLARESARGFVSSSNDEIAFAVAEEIVSQGSKVLGFANDSSGSRVTMKVDCLSKPCISPDNSVRISLTLNRDGEPAITVRALEYVSPWA
jgi:Flp pilus assembly protein TadG